MERDNQFILGGFLIVLVTLISFNVNTITGNNVSSFLKIYLGVSDFNDNNILGNTFCTIEKNQDTGFCSLTLSLDERTLYTFRTVSPDEWFVNWLKITDLDGNVVKEFFCNKANECNFKFTTLKVGQEYIISTQVSKVVNSDFYGEKQYTIEASSEKVPGETNSFASLFVYTIASNGWVKEIKECKNTGKDTLTCSLTLSLDDYIPYTIRSDTSGTWEIKSLKLLKDGKILYSDFCDAETCQFSFNSDDLQ